MNNRSDIFAPSTVLKKIPILIFTLFYLHGYAQDSIINKTKKDSFKIETADSLKRDSSKKIIVSAAITDSSGKPDSVGVLDSGRKAVVNSMKPVVFNADSIKKSLSKKKQTIKPPPGMAGEIRGVANVDILFYILVFITFFLALIRQSFPKYFNSIFSLSFQATFRQTQTRDQMSQNFFPAFMLNVLFILSTGLFITLFAQFYKWTAIPFWQLFVYATSILGIIYLVKYCVILFTGWVFNVPDSAAEYRFIVFLINKTMGVLFIPLLFIIAYSDNDVKKIAITIALCVAGFLISLRYLVSLARIRRNLNMTAFHFFIYLCAVEIMPLLVIYKILFLNTGNI